MQHGAERFHSAILFPVLVALLVAQPILAALSALAAEVLGLPLIVSLVASIWSLDRGGRWLRVGIAIALGLVAVALWGFVAPSPNAYAWLFVGLAALTWISVALGVRWLLTSARITAQTLLFAVSAYLLIATSFGFLFCAIHAIAPDAFHGVSPAGHPAQTAELIYYSIGALSTSALGDILPTHPVTRLLTNIESVTGQLYMAVLVAILITGYASQPEQR